MSKKKQTPKKAKQQSVKEFKAWLAGMLEFQPEDWTPTVDQWKTIQERINNLQDVEPTAAAPAAPAQPMAPQYQQPMNPPTLFAPQPMPPPGAGLDMRAQNLIDSGEQLMDTSHFPKAPISTGMPAGASMAHVSSTVIPRARLVGNADPNPEKKADPYKSPFA
jgi:hypothetical protein